MAANRAFEVFNEGVDPALLAPPVNRFRHALHPDGLAPRVRNLPEWGRHITGPCSRGAPTRLWRNCWPSFEAFLPADERTADVLRRRWG